MNPNILLVVPRYISYPGQYYDFPSGLGYVIAALKKQGFSVGSVNLNHHWGPIETVLREHIHAGDYNVLCTGGLSLTYNLIEEVLLAGKGICPDIVTVIGGGLVTSEPEFVLRQMPQADIGVLGEGERTIVELAQAWKEERSLSSVRGIIYREKGDLIKTAERETIADIDDIPFPDYEALELGAYLDQQHCCDDIYLSYALDHPRMVPILASRNCPYKCTFCYHPLGSRYRQRSLDNVFEEIDYLIEHYRINAIMFFDDLFTVNRKRVIEFCERMEPLKLKYYIQVRVDNVDEELLELLKKSGCVCISYGIESASNKVLQSMKKKITVEKIEKALELTYQKGIGIQGNFIFGDPAEDEETVSETLDWWLQHQKYRINLSFIRLYPKSELYMLAEQKAIIHDHNKLEVIRNGGLLKGELINISCLPGEQYHQLKQKVIDMDRQIKLPGLLKKIHFSDYHPDKGHVISLQFCCFHCSKEVEYHNIIFNPVPRVGKTVIIACRHCNQRSELLLPPYDQRKAIQDYEDYVNGEWAGEIRNIQDLVAPPIPNLANNEPLEHQAHARSIELVRKHSGSRPLAVFGSGAYGQIVIGLLQDASMSVQRLYDNNPGRWGEELFGVKIGDPGEIDENMYVVIASGWAKEIAAQLTSLGLRHGTDFTVFHYSH
ncbi:radical SAM protein [Heliobacterium gestii]|uniref:Radical SAM protein n=1 Tax=Heliomicrobium gestii TaxID=2699 RepID=A0A845L8E5_HELGE|nr:radical SAM protein [Heliomicrobium gestii]MBM7866703.1 hypothetical protein [Heliomicrobium gestii]MZP43017.1 radical SAM protein [Heliomicrobium gestii]